MTGKPPASIHAGVAEQGKVHALRGDHVNALRHYREAMAMASREHGAEIACRHYLECALESLEHMGAYDELLQYCSRALEHYRDHPPAGELARFDLANVHQRRGVALLKQGAREAAISAFELACDAARGVQAPLPLSETLLRWLRARLTVSAERLRAEQIRHRYFSVRSETVRPARALPLPGQVPISAATARVRPQEGEA